MKEKIIVAVALSSIIVNSQSFDHFSKNQKFTMMWNDSVFAYKNNETMKEDTLYFSFYSEYEDTSASGSTYPLWYGESYNLLSIVGNIVSYEMSYEGSGGPHPIYGSYTTAVNLERNEEANLRDIFDESDILTALKEDTLLVSSTSKPNTNNLYEFINNLDGECEVSFSNFLSRFFFSEVVDDSVIVSFGLPHGCEVMRGKTTEIDIKLPIKGSYARFIKEADKTKTLCKYLNNY